MIELIVVVLILAILAGILTLLVTGYIQQSERSTDLANAKLLYVSGVLVLSDDDASTSLDRYVGAFPVVQSMAGATFEVWSIAGSVEVYVDAASALRYDPVSNEFVGGTLPTASSTVVKLG